MDTVMNWLGQNQWLVVSWSAWALLLYFVFKTRAYENLSLGRLLWTGLLVVLVYGFAQVFALEMALAFAADTVLYFEVVATVIYFAARVKLRHAVVATRMHLSKAHQNLARKLRPLRVAGRRWRATVSRASLRLVKAARPPPDEGRPAKGFRGAVFAAA